MSKKVTVRYQCDYPRCPNSALFNIRVADRDEEEEYPIMGRQVGGLDACYDHLRMAEYDDGRVVWDYDGPALL